MEERCVHLFVFAGFSDWETSYAIAELKRVGGFRLVTVAPTSETILSGGGLRIVPDLTLESLNPLESALLLLPGGPAWETGNIREAPWKIKEFLDHEVPVAAIGESVSCLARLDLFDDRYHAKSATHP